MMSRSTMGTCSLCGGRFGRASMTRHLEKCGQSQSPPASAKQAKRPAKGSFHLFVQGRHAKQYWMHLDAPVDTPLGDLDSFLRRTWLECCGHLSQFNIGGKVYALEPMKEEGDLGMGAKLSRVLHPGMVFTHEYDFGSTTELTLKVLGPWERGTAKGAIELLAQNDAPEVTCDQCKTQPATQVCTTCQWQGGGWLCETCAADHECGLDMCLPVVNSPRVGVCGYSG